MAPIFMDSMAPLFDYDSHRKGPSTPVRRSIRLAKQLNSGEELDLLSKLEKEDDGSLSPNNLKPNESIIKSNLRWSYSYSAPADEINSLNNSVHFPFYTSQPASSNERHRKSLEFEKHQKNIGNNNHHYHKPATSNYLQNDENNFSDSSLYTEKSSSSDSMIFLKAPRVSLAVWISSKFSNLLTFFTIPYNISIKYTRLVSFFVVLILLLLVVNFLYQRAVTNYSYDFPIDLGSNEYSKIASNNLSSVKGIFTKMHELEKHILSIAHQQQQLADKVLKLSEYINVSGSEFASIISRENTLEKNMEILSSKLSFSEKQYVNRTFFDFKISSVVAGFMDAISNISSTESKMLNDIENRFLRNLSKRTTDLNFTPPDYALYTLGAKPLLEHSSDTLHVLSGFISRTFGLGVIGKPHYYALVPGAIPGNCWCFNRKIGNFSFSIAKPITPTSFSIDHPSASSLSDRSSAPRIIELWASTNLNLDSNRFISFLSKKFKLTSSQIDPWDVYLGQYEYDLQGSYIQTFTIESFDSMPYPPVFKSYQLRILDNWGKSEYTCIYKIRLHSSFD